MTSSDPFVPPSADPIPPLDWARRQGKVALVLGTLETKLRARRRSRIRKATGAACLLFILGFASWAVPLVRDTKSIVTAPASRQRITLADGSEVELNARTDLRTDFRYGRRRATLTQGEAFFSVVKDSAHPFFVQTPVGTVRVTGTHFDVRVPTGNDAEVTLVEGSVTVSREGGEARLTTLSLQPGQQAILGETTSQTRTLSRTELDNALSWRTGRLVMDGLTLGEAVARVSAYHGKEIKVSPSIANLHVGGSCPLDDLPGFLEYLKADFAVQVTAQGDGSIQIDR